MINKIKRVILVCINYFIRFLTNKTFHTIAIIWLLISQFVQIEMNKNFARKYHNHETGWITYAKEFHEHHYFESSLESFALKSHEHYDYEVYGHSHSKYAKKHHTHY